MKISAYPKTAATLLFLVFCGTNAARAAEKQAEIIDVGDGKSATLVLQSEREAAALGGNGVIGVKTASSLKEVPVNLKACEYYLTRADWPGHPVRLYYYELNSADSKTPFSWGMWGSYYERVCIFRDGEKNFLAWVDANSVKITGISKEMSKRDALILRLSTDEPGSGIMIVPVVQLVGGKQIFRGTSAAFSDIKIRNVYEKNGNLVLQVMGTDEDQVYTLVRENGVWRKQSPEPPTIGTNAIAAVKSILPQGWTILKTEDNTYPDYRPKGNGTAVFLGISGKTYLKQQYSAVLYIMPPDYQDGGDDPTHGDAASWPARLIATTKAAKLYLWPGPQAEDWQMMQADLLRAIPHVEAEFNGTLRQHNLNELDSFFGPLPKAEQLITGVDLKGFIQTLLGDQAKLPLCSPLRRSVGYRYKLSLASDSRTTPLFIDIGVYDSADTANSVLVDEWGAVSAPGHPASGFGDRAVASPTCVRAIVNNVFVCVSLSPANEELFKTIVDKLVQELRSGTTCVTRGKTVPVPRIASLNLPDRMAGDETYDTVVGIENTDTSKLLLGVSGDERVSVNRVGSEIRLNVKANRKPGRLKAVLCVATPDNVVATAEISVAVQ